MLNGYCLMVKDYKAEIVEFATISIINMPDDSKTYLIQTKYGAEYRKESELSETKEVFEKECADINESFQKAQNRGDKWIYHKRN